MLEAIFRMDETAALTSMGSHFDTLRTDVVTMVEAISRPAEAAPRRRRAAKAAKGARPAAARAARHHASER